MCPQRNPGRAEDAGDDRRQGRRLDQEQWSAPRRAISGDPAERLFGDGALGEDNLARREARVEAEGIRRAQLGPVPSCPDRAGVDDPPPVVLAQQRGGARHEAGGKDLQPQIAERERPPKRHHQSLGPQPFTEWTQQRERGVRGENLTSTAAYMRNRAPPTGPQDCRVRQEDQVATGGSVASHHRPGQPDSGAVKKRVLILVRPGHGRACAGRSPAGAAGTICCSGPNGACKLGPA